MNDVDASACFALLFMTNVTLLAGVSFVFAEAYMALDFHKIMVPEEGMAFI